MPAGYASTYGFTMAWSVSVAVGVVGSFVSSVTVLAIGPANALVSTWAETLPVSPGLTTLSNSATVQPHAGRAAMICRSAVPVFFTAKTQLSFSPLGTVP